MNNDSTKRSLRPSAGAWRILGVLLVVLPACMSASMPNGSKDESSRDKSSSIDPVDCAQTPNDEICVACAPYPGCIECFNNLDTCEQYCSDGNDQKPGCTKYTLVDDDPQNQDNGGTDSSSSGTDGGQDGTDSDDGSGTGTDGGTDSGGTDGYDSGGTDGYDSGGTDGYDSGGTDGYDSGGTDGYDGYDSGGSDGYDGYDGYDYGDDGGGSDGYDDYA